MSISMHVIEHPAWIKILVEDVLMPTLTPLAFLGPLGFRYWRPDDPLNVGEHWTVAVYPTPTEVRGQHAADGAVFVAGFRLDIGKIVANMNAVDEVIWNSPQKYTGNLDGPEVSIRGRFAGHLVQIRFFHVPPPDELPAFAINPTTGEAFELSA